MHKKLNEKLKETFPAITFGLHGKICTKVELCTKMFKKLSEKRRAEFASTYTWLLHAKICRLDDAF